MRACWWSSAAKAVAHRSAFLIRPLIAEKRYINGKIGQQGKGEISAAKKRELKAYFNFSKSDDLHSKPAKYINEDELS